MMVLLPRQPEQQPAGRSLLGDQQLAKIRTDV